MSEFVSDCPRCGAQNITFDCYSSIWMKERFGWMNVLEVFVVCRHCHKPSIQRVNQRANDSNCDAYCKNDNSLAAYKGSINNVVKFDGFITLKDTHSYKAPDHVPEDIKKVVEEANSCLAGGCFNAAGAMYRLALDIATKALFPEGNEPATKIRRSLGLRIQWLFDQRLLPHDLANLAECLQHDGNDGAHDGTLLKEDAEDLQDFCFELLKRLYTEPTRLTLAEERRKARRKAREGEQ